MSLRWLLVLGSDEAGGAPIPAALEALQRIERGIGRAEDSAGVPIDIDLLACDPDGAGWQLDPHAAQKTEHRRPHVVALLEEAGITLP